MGKGWMAQPPDYTEDESCHEETDPEGGEDTEKPLPKEAPSVVSSGASGDQIAADTEETVDRDWPEAGLVDSVLDSETADADDVRHDDDQGQDQPQKVQAVVTRIERLPDSAGHRPGSIVTISPSPAVTIAQRLRQKLQRASDFMPC